jgi:hypothetical protein
MSLMEGKNYWFLSLIICRSMQVWGSARLHVLDLLWGNNLCLPIVKHAKNKRLWVNRGQHIVAKMVDTYNETSEKKHKFIQFVAIFWLLKLGRPLIDFENMKEFFDILFKWRTLYINTSLTPLARRWLKACIGFSLNRLELLCKKLSTLLATMMKSPQLTISLGVVFMLMLLTTLKGFHYCWI